MGSCLPLGSTSYGSTTPMCFSRMPGSQRCLGGIGAGAWAFLHQRRREGAGESPRQSRSSEQTTTPRIPCRERGCLIGSHHAGLPPTRPPCTRVCVCVCVLRGAGGGAGHVHFVVLVLRLLLHRELLQRGVDVELVGLQLAQQRLPLQERRGQGERGWGQAATDLPRRPPASGRIRCPLRASSGGGP